MSEPGYREFAPHPALVGKLACTWMRTAGELDGPVLPDGCMDVIWLEGHGLIVAGPDTGPARSRLRPGSVAAGVRFAPAAAPAFLGVPASELRDLRVGLSEVLGDGGAAAEERVAAAGSPPARLEALQRELLRLLPGAPAPDPAVTAAVGLLRGGHDGRVGALGARLGLSERQLRRRFHAAVGYGPKTLARVLRFQRLRSLAGRGPADLAALAFEAGYADQAHMSGECTRLGGAPPSRLLAA